MQFVRRSAHELATIDIRLRKMPLNLITWNIQWGCGCDHRVDLQRIVRIARATADFDVLCLQEVARNFPGLPGSDGEDQFRLLAELLPGYTAIEGVGTDVRAHDGAPVPPSDGARSQFGNIILTRLLVLQAFRHLLPWPAEPAVPSMQRAAVEVVLQAPWGPLRVITTHLEYYSARQRAAQVERLRDLHAEAAAHARDVDHSRKEGGPFKNAARPAAAILTADFNFRPDDPLYARLQAPYADDTRRYVDAWQIRYPGRPHAPTIGVFDREQWPEPFACDFVFVTEDLADRVGDARVNTDTDASDHQPVLLTLN
jgi:endonuclease/exonuclease/phosphatase family metal-dependent hydrolase